MLKSQVFVALCSMFLSIAWPAAAFTGHSGSPASGSAPVAPGSSLVSHAGWAVSHAGSSVSHAGFSVSFARPGRMMRPFIAKYLRENDSELWLVRERSGRPFTIIDSVMAVYELPGDLRYLAVIESELQPSATSRVGARGPWQLMAATARDLGLKVSRRSDERTNYYKSTRAAALYLRDLHREFRDWLLVLAAYNAGPGPVERAIRLAGSRNFWALERYLPAETRQHVKRFIATAYYFTASGTADPAPATSVCLVTRVPVYYRVNPSADGAAAGFGLKAVSPGAPIVAAVVVGLTEYELGANGVTSAARREEELVALAIRMQSSGGRG